MISSREMMLGDHGSGSLSRRQIKDKMVCTDLDGTLIGDDQSMYELLDTLERKGVQKPEAMICMVGTEVYFAEQGEFRLDQRWSELISRGWHRQKVIELMRDIHELSWQDSRWQTDFKVIYLLKENQEAVLKEIDRRLQEAGLDAKVIYSCNQFLDFLPGRSSKNGALHYITEKLGIDREDVTVCGNSGNDLEMFKAGYRGIVAGNAYPELRSYMGDNAYHAAAQYAAGITEGLNHVGYFGTATAWWGPLLNRPCLLKGLHLGALIKPSGAV